MGENQKNQLEKIAILTDTGSNISFEKAKNGIYILPLQIIEDEQSYLDMMEITTETVYQKNYNRVLMKTSLPPLQNIYSILEKIQNDGYDSVILIPLTPGISSSASVIQSAAEEKKIPLTLIDIFTTCTIQKYVVYEAKRYINLGYTREDIKNKLQNQITHSNSFILANDINHLKRGGRLTPLAASFANMLKIVPILTMNESTKGKIDVLEKVRTTRKAKKRLVELTLESMHHDNYQFFILHSDDEKGANELKQLLIEHRICENKIVISEFNSVIAVHVGMKCLAIQHIENI